jgi:putative transposase
LGVPLAHVERLAAALVLVKPDTVLAWHRRGFRLFWAWKSRHGVGRPAMTPEIGMLIHQMIGANPLWGAPRIHGELLKLGFFVSQSTVARYMPRRHGPPSPSWRSFLATHASQVMAADFFVVPTLTYRLLCVLVILAHDRRRIVHVAVTDHPTATWTAQQLRNAFPNDEAPQTLLHDRDAALPMSRPPSQRCRWRTSSQRHVHHGRSPTSSASSDPFDANALITWSS